MGLCNTSETVEVAVCGHTEVHGGAYEWTCVKPPHEGNSDHYMRAFPRAENTQ